MSPNLNRCDYPREMNQVLYRTLQGKGYVCPKCKQPFYNGERYVRKTISNNIPKRGNIYHVTCLTDAYGEPIFE